MRQGAGAEAKRLFVLNRSCEVVGVPGSMSSTCRLIIERQASVSEEGSLPYLDPQCKTLACTRVDRGQVRF